MNIQSQNPKRPPVWLNAGSGDFETFRQIVSQNNYGVWAVKDRNSAAATLFHTIDVG